MNNKRDESLVARVRSETWRRGGLGVCLFCWWVGVFCLVCGSWMLFVGVYVVGKGVRCIQCFGGMWCVWIECWLI